MANHLLTRLARSHGESIEWRRSLALALVLLLSACADSEPDTTPPRLDVTKAHVSLAALQALSLTQGRGLLSSVENLQGSIEDFLQLPDGERQETAQTAWRSAHEAFVSFTGLPLMNLPEPAHYQLDAWPIEPGYLDTLAAYPDSGLISDLTVDISLESLRDQHGFTDVTEVSLGFHALELLIFAREPKDFVTQTTITPVDDLAASDEIVTRRRRVLSLLAEQILVDLSPWLTTSAPEPLPASVDLKNQQLLELLTRSRQRAMFAQSQVDKLLIAGTPLPSQGHGSRADLSRRVTSLQQIFFSPVELGALFLPMAGSAVNALQRTLEETQGLCDLTDIDDNQRTQLGLLLQLLPDQIEALSQVLAED